MLIDSNTNLASDNLTFQFSFDEYSFALQHHQNVCFYENFNCIKSIWEMNTSNLHRRSKNENSPKLQNVKLK